MEEQRWRSTRFAVRRCSSYRQWVIRLVCSCVAALFATSSSATTDQWTTNGPQTSTIRINTVVVDPTRSSTIYVGNLNGVFKSIDGGVHWLPSSTGLTNLAVEAIAIDPKNSRTLYIGTADGVFKSVDGGGQWQASSSGLTQRDVRFLAVVPALPSTVFAGVATDAGSALFKSADAGAHWQMVRDFPGPRIFTIVPDPTSSSTLYVSTHIDHSGGFWKSTDGGVSWTSLQKGLPSGPHSVGLDVRDPSLLYAGTFDGVYKSQDGGKTWTNMNNGGVGTTTVYQLVVDPVQTNTVYVAMPRGIFKSTLGGAEWAPKGRGISGVKTLAIDPQQPSTLYVGTISGGLYKSINGAESWTAINQELSGVGVVSLVGNPATTQKLYAGVIDNGMFMTQDGGATWVAPPELPKNNTTLLALTTDPAGAIIYGAGERLFRSLDSGANWKILKPLGLKNPNLQTFAFAPGAAGGTPGVLFAGTGPLPGAPVNAAAGIGGVYKSTDNGANWVESGEGLPSTNRFVQTLLVDPSTPTTLYAGTGIAFMLGFGDGVYKSTDSGAHWTPANTNLRNTDVRTLVIDTKAPQTLYAGTDRGVFKSLNGGASWMLASKGLPAGFVHALVMAPNQSRLLYAGTPFGVFLSTDAGESWTSLNKGLTNLVVLSLSLSPSSPSTLYAGTSSGIFRLSVQGLRR